MQLTLSCREYSKGGWTLKSTRPEARQRETKTFRMHRLPNMSSLRKYDALLRKRDYVHCYASLAC